MEGSPKISRKHPATPMVLGVAKGWNLIVILQGQLLLVLQTTMTLHDLLQQRHGRFLGQLWVLLTCCFYRLPLSLTRLPVREHSSLLWSPKHTTSTNHTTVSVIALAILSTTTLPLRLLLLPLRTLTWIMFILPLCLCKQTKETSHLAKNLRSFRKRPRLTKR